MNPAFRDHPVVRLLLAQLEANELQITKGKDPVGFLLQRLRFPEGVSVSHVRNCRDEGVCTLRWWPNGERDRAVPVPSRSTTVQRRRIVRAEQMAYGFTVLERLAMREPETAHRIASDITRATGLPVTVESERATFRRLHPEYPSERPEREG